MAVGETTTVLDDGAERDSARDAWKASTMHYFHLAVEHTDADPDRCLQELRKVLEGWAHLVCVVLDPTFRPYERKELRREPLARVLERAREHLPPQRRNAIKGLKTLADEAHHNQGHIQQTPPRIARAGVLQCADLLEWLHTDVLHEAVPAMVADLGVRDSGQSAVSAPTTATGVPRTRSHRAIWWSGAAVGTIAGFVYAVFAIPEDRPSPNRAPTARAEETPGSPTASASASAAPMPAPGAAKADALALVRAYETAIATEDVDRILALHRFPTNRWFLAKNATREDVRNGYAGWFKKHDRRVAFEDCRLVEPGVALCQSGVDPPLEEHPGRVPTCFVFDESGLLISRTELNNVPECPPTGLERGGR